MISDEKNRYVEIKKNEKKITIKVVACPSKLFLPSYVSNFLCSKICWISHFFAASQRTLSAICFNLTTDNKQYFWFFLLVFSCYFISKCSHDILVISWFLFLVFCCDSWLKMQVMRYISLGMLMCTCLIGYNHAASLSLLMPTSSRYLSNGQHSLSTDTISSSEYPRTGWFRLFFRCPI